jgi:hypothetical protein
MDPHGTSWLGSGDAMRMRHRAVCAALLSPCDEAMFAESPGDDELLLRLFREGATRWSVRSAASGEGHVCACGKRDIPTVFCLEQLDSGKTLDVGLECVKAFDYPTLVSQARAAVKSGKILVEARAARAAAASDPRAPAYPTNVLALAKKNGWLTGAAVSGYGTSRAATAVVHRTMARVLEEGMLAQKSAPKVYRLVAPCDAAKELGLRWHEGAPYWRGVESCAPADVRNRIAADSELDWDNLGNTGEQDA